MVNSIHIASMKKRAHQNRVPDYSALRYWLIWALVIAGLAYGIHRYFEYRNAELDRRLEKLESE